MKPRHIVVSMLVAVFGLAAVFVAQPSLGQTTQPNPAPVAAPQAQTKTIVIAVRPLRFGTEIKEEHLREVEWVQSAIPSGSFESIEELLSVEGRRAVLSPIEPNEPVLSWKITGPGEPATRSAVVDYGKRAMSISISDVHGVAGFVLPGDRVDIMLTRADYTDILLQNIKILAIDHLADQPKSVRTATVEVNTVDAQMLTLAQTAGTLSLDLRAAGPVGAAAPRRGDFPNDPLRCDFPYGRCDAFMIYGEGEEDTAVDLLAKKIEETFQAIETRINQMGQEFRGTHPIDTGTMAFDPNAREGVIRGMSRSEYEVPKLNSDTQLENRSSSGKCAAAAPRHPFAGRHPCFPE
jgi:pilus assembly protein CpaB